jgi:hypothetical protein
LNITMAAPSIGLLHEIVVAADTRLLARLLVGGLVGHEFARVVVGLGLRLRNATALGLRMREPVVDGGAIFGHRSSFRQPMVRRAGAVLARLRARPCLGAARACL